VLVADDYADHCQSLALLVQRWGHDVRMVLDGAAALESAVDWQPDVVLADIGMPLLDGYDLAKQMRGQSCFQHTTLIAISGYADDAHRVQGIEAGYDFYLAKPAKLSQLQGILCRELGRLRLGTMLGVKATS
jgi:two-component system CheB/CheR fusion protein